MALSFNTEPYFDDYDATKDYYRILFRPSYAVQARELTQIQSILQSQVSRFGDHVFKNGSQVIPGSVNVDNQFHFIKLEPFTGTVDINTYIEQFRDKIITGEQSGVRMRVVDTSLCDCVVDKLGIATLYCKIEGVADNGETKRLIQGENIIAYETDNLKTTNFKLTEDQVGDLTAVIRSTADDGSIGTVYTGNEEKDVIGLAYGVDVKEGIYYIDGIFVRNPELHLYVGRFSNTPTARVGFKVIEETIAPEDDVTLLDNATGSYNYAAPGAHRYKISLKLVKLPLVSTDNIKFVELLRIVDGRVQQKIEKATYAEIAKTLARRTFDESGNYEVNKFVLSVRDHLNTGSNFGMYPAAPNDYNPLTDKTVYGNSDLAVLAMDPGKAYIDGYEVESVATQYTNFDKARGNDHIKDIDLDPVGVPIGNYVLVKKVYNRPDIAAYEEVYLSKTFATNGTAPSSTDIVGKARIKAFELYDGDYTAGTSAKYKLALFDIKMNSGYSFEKDVKSVTSTKASGIFTCDIVPTLLTVGGVAALTNGSTALNIFTSELRAGDIIYLLDGTLVGTVSTAPTLASFGTLTSNYTGTTAATAKIAVFRAKLNLDNREGLLYNVGYEYVKTLLGKNNTGGFDLNRTTITTSVVFGSQTASTSTNQIKVTFSASGGEFLDSADLRNFTLFDSVTNLPVNIGTGNIMFATVNGSADRTSVTFYCADSDTLLVNNRNYTLIAAVTRTANYGSAKTKDLNTSFQQNIYGKKTVTANSIDLEKCDIYRLIKVEVDPNSYTEFNEDNAVDITSQYTLDNGQRDSYYGVGKLLLKPGMPVPSGCLRVTYDYFTVAGATGQYFSVDSYSGVLSIDEIPTYYNVGSDGKKVEVNLSDVIDFRPYIGGTNTWTPELPKFASSVVTPIAYYMGRQDKIVLDSVGRINIIKGVPALYPKEPEDPKEGMVIASVYVPPYTKDIKQIKVSQRDNRRYTMRDIGKLERRISNLEYYVALSALEKDTATMDIKDDDGLDKYKNGFVVDQFTGHGVGDVKSDDYRIAVDPQNKQLRPMTYTAALEIVEDLVSDTQRTSLPYQKTNDLITLPYVETEFIFNNNATRSLDVNPYKIGAFKGEITLYPQGDNWVDTERRPDLRVTDNNNYDAIKYMADKLGVTGTVFNYHETNWNGALEPTDPVYSQTGNPNARRQIVTGYQTDMYTQTGVIGVDKITTSLKQTDNLVDYGDRVVDMSFAPFMRARPVTFLARNLKANTRFWAFFDNVKVNEHITPANVFKVTRSGTTKMSFSMEDLQNQTVGDNPDRAYNGKIETAFAVGDLVKNSEHAGVNINSIANITAPAGASTFTVSVASVAGISLGHHVRFENLAVYGGTPSYTLYDLRFNQNVPASSGIKSASVASTSRYLNMRTYRVIGINGVTLTLEALDKSTIPAFEPYSTSSYNTGYSGRLKRLQAAGIVMYDGYVSESDAYGIKVQEIHVVNVKNGFGVGDTLAGTSVIAGTQQRNNCTINSINGVESTSVVPTLKVKGDKLYADSDGSVIGVFDIPNTSELSFRTGERTFKLIDNESNSDAGFDSKGSVVYYSQGVTLSKEKTIVNSRTASFVQDRLYEEIPVRRVVPGATRQIYSYYTGHDPVAQTFVVSSTGGVFVTSVDVFFRESGVRPVTVELRNTNNSIPGTKVIPFSQVTKTAQQLNLSDDGSKATTFKFDAPIYLQDGETYALIVKTDEPGCQLFVSELGKTDLITKNVITSQPLTGSLYLSQNSKEFEINPLLDMKFVLRKAKFNTGTVDVNFRANPPAPYKLQANPFEITPGTNKVRVYAQDHGFLAGEKVTISGVPEGFYGTTSTTAGIPASALNGEHVIQYWSNAIQTVGYEKDSFIIEIPLTETVDGVTTDVIVGSVNSFVKGQYGGDSVISSRGLNMDILFLKNNDLNFQDTNISYTMDVTEMDGTTTSGIIIPANANYVFDTRKHVKSYENQSFQGNNDYKNASLKFKATLSSTNPNVSPVIDTQKLSVYTIANLVDNMTQSNVNLAEIDARTLVDYVAINAGDVRATGSGNITITTSQNTISGNYVSSVSVGNTLKDLDGLTIGIVQSVTTSLITLTSTAFVPVTNAGWTIWSQQLNQVTPTGTITTSISSTTVTGAGNANFLTDVPVGTILHKTDGTPIGTVASVQSATSLTLEANAKVAVSGVAFKAYIPWNMQFSNTTVDGETVGVITTNIDTADNLLANATIGKYITISGVKTGVDGTYLVKNVISASDVSTIAGNAEQDKVTVYVSPAFGSSSVPAYFDMVADTDFSIKQLDKYVEDFAPIGIHNAANYITRNLILAQEATDIKVIFDSCIVSGTSVDIYYRTWSGTADLKKLPYKKAALSIPAYDVDGVFKERTIDVKGIIPGFTSLAIKIVMKSSNPAKVPILKNLRVIATS